MDTATDILVWTLRRPGDWRIPLGHRDSFAQVCHTAPDEWRWQVRLQRAGSCRVLTHRGVELTEEAAKHEAEKILRGL